MRDGFTFCGVDIADLKISYAPELQDTYVYAPAETESHFEEFEAHDGGYYYGSWKKVKNFSLRCYFEEKVVDKEIMSRVFELFRPGRSGKLIFKRRPWCYYWATVDAVPVLDLTNYLNGLITISMTATYPFARSDILYRNRTDPYRDNMLLNTAIYEHEDMVPTAEFKNVTSEFNFVLGNPGTEPAPLGVYVEGDASAGIIITNHTTQQQMKLTAFSKSVTTNQGKKLYIDSMNGKTLLKNETTSQYALKYHQSGYLSLQPGYPAHRNVYISYENGNTVTTKAYFHDNVVGKYIYADGSWHKILSQPDKNTFIVLGQISNVGIERTQIMTMNEFNIKPVDTVDINISFVFKPTYA